MSMNLKRLALLAALLLCRTVAAATIWSTQDYDLYPGDFDGDGVADLLYVAKDPAKLSGIARGVGGGFDTSFQSWPSNFLGLQWGPAQYNVVVLPRATGASRFAIILLQSKVAGGSSYLLSANAQGRIIGIYQTLTTAGGVDWSAGAHRIVPGDFNNDGIMDVFLQATNSSGTNAVMLADQNGQFSAAAPAQQWTDGFLGFNWATSEAIIFAGNFDGQFGTDLLVQARPKTVIIDFDPPFPIPTYPPNMNGVLFAHSSGDLFQAAAVPGETQGYLQWSRNAFGVDWSPLKSNIVIGNFNGTTRSDIVLQATASGSASYLVSASGTNAVFSAGAALASNVNWSGDAVRLIAGNFVGGAVSGIYLQATGSSGTNALATTITGSSVTTTSQDPTQTPPGIAAIAAGRTGASFTISDSGSSNYSIPLWAPPGVGAVQPKLALNYSSRGPDGVMGVGWTLSGLSAISRCNRTWEQDGVVRGVMLTSSDRFCLDGRQLKLTGGSAGLGGSTYATEVESFSLITANGPNSGPPTSFTVTTKGGLIYDYGLTTDSQIMAGSSGPVRTWAVSQIRDRVGNAIKLSYYNDAAAGTGYTNGTYRIKQIDYPYTASGQGPFYSVTFTYGGRATGANVPIGYVTGSLTQEPNELNTIVIRNFNSSTPTRTYSLGYVVNSMSSRLRMTQVQECSASHCLLPTKIDYQNGVFGWSSAPSVTTGATSAPSRVIPIDLNGDGITDVVYPVNGGSGYVWNVVYGNPSGTFSAPQPTGVTTATGDALLPADFAAHGSTDLLYPSGGNWWRLYWNGTSLSTANTGSQIASVAQSAVNTVAADFNGDGLPDLVYPVDDGQGDVSIYVALNTTTPGGTVGFGAPSLVYTKASVGFNFYSLYAGSTFSSGTGGSPIAIADFNGDGLADMLIHIQWVNRNEVTHVTTTNYQWLELVSQGTTFAAAAQFTYQTPGYRLVTLDWNGDGCTDLAEPGVGGVGNWIIYSGTCAASGALAGGVDTGIPDTQPIIAADWDGDGRDDLLTVAGNGAWQMLRSTDAGPTGSLRTLNITAGSSAWFVGDFNGDGQNDLGFVDVTASNTIKADFHNSTASPPDLATSFSDGFGMIQTLTYVPLSQSNYSKCVGGSISCATATLPEADYQGPLYVVDQFTATDGTGSTYQNKFWYYGAAVDMQGRGFEGFFARRSFDSRNGVYTFDFDNRAFPYTGMPGQRVATTSDTYISRNLSCTNATTHCLSSSIATSSVQTVTGLGGFESRVFHYQLSNTQDSYEYGGSLDGQVVTTILTQYQYGDGFGNLTNIQATTTDNDPASPYHNSTWTTTTASTFLNDTTAGCIGLPTGTAITSSAQGQTPLTRTYSYVPDTNHALCREQQRIIEPNTAALNVTETLTYDICGNISEADVLGHNPDGSQLPVRATHYNYSYFTARCQLPEQITNALAQWSSVAYNYDFGVPSEVKDGNGVPVDWSYDDFGRRLQERHADGTSKNWSYRYCVNAPCWGFNDLRLLISENDLDATGVGSFSRDRFYDGVLRLRYDESNRALQTWTINQARSYDSLGRLAKDSQPFSQSDNGYWSYGYDSLDRRTSAVLFRTSGQNATQDRSYSWLYAGRTVQLTDPLTNIHKTVTDVSGHLRKVIDPKPGQGGVPGATTTYDYDDFGNLVGVTDPIGATTTSTYNLRGFETDMVDADAGVWHFNADSLNQLLSYTDGNGRAFGPNSYDQLGRLTQRTEPEGVSTWVWGNTAAAHDIGSLDSVAGYGYSEVLGYDQIGRLQTRTITTDQAYQYGYSYNSIGAVDTVTYPTPAPSGGSATPTKIQYGYSYGVAVQISDVTQSSPVSLWSLGALNDYSSPMREYFGANLISVASSYTPWTNDITGIQSGAGGSASNRQNLAYQWDTGGNLQYRQDLLQKVEETFAYDALHRPISATLNTGATLTAAYTDTSGNDLGGNIASRSDVGTASHAYDYTTQQASCNYTGLTPQPHAVRNAGGGAYVYCYDKNGNVTQRNGLAITWASYNLPTSLQATLGGGTYSSQFSYGPERQRYNQTATYSNGTEVTWYAGGLFEKVTGTAAGGVISYRNYVLTPSGAAIVITRTSAPTSATTYVLTDHLGSSDVVLDGASGNLLVQESFGLFGQRRSSNWAAGGPTVSEWGAIAKATRRGFTFQEELDNVGLVDMNARIYDPNVGRFLSADPVIGSLEDAQSFNPYAYVGNRPLTAVDPSGKVGELDTVVVSAGGPETPVGAVLTVADLALDFSQLFGLFGAAAPPPPPLALNAQSAQTGSGQNLCRAGAGAGCGPPVSASGTTDLGEVVVRSGTLFPKTAAGDIFDGLGVYGSNSVISDVEFTPDDPTSIETITVTGSRYNPYFPGNEPGLGEPDKDLYFLFATGGPKAGISIVRSLGGIIERSLARDVARGTAKDALEAARALGKAGEDAANIVKNTARIESLTKTAAYRIPDVLNADLKIIGEVKNVSNLSYTAQLQDFMAYANKYGYTFQLWTRASTELSPQLQELIDAGKIVQKFLPP